MKKDNLGAIAIIVGTCIGAGIFGLPYVISQTGIIIGIVYLVVMAFIVSVTTLAYGEVVLRTKGTHQFPEYVNIYLGPQWKKLAIFSLFTGFYGALIAYLTECGVFLYNILHPYLGGTVLDYQLIYFTVVAIAVFLGLGVIQRLEKIMILAILFIVLLVIIFGLPHIELNNLIYMNPKNALIPYGVILFALTASSAVPDMKNILKKNKSNLKKCIIIGMIIPLMVYIVFSLIVVGISGINTSENAVNGLGSFLGSTALVVGSIFGLLTMTTSFLTLSLVLKEVYYYDFKLNKYLAWALVVLPVLFVVLGNFLTFIEVIGISGAVIGGVNGVIIVHLYKVAKNKGQREPEYKIKLSRFFAYLIYLVFIGGIFYESYMVLAKFF